ncbi:sugar (Glycoside-Pentoside-Hexuronide) transporter [Dorea longicatena]|nr:sugar (Glycoside-Pentoside-Hexuronide) transporter [Dorea longicatena]
MPYLALPAVMSNDPKEVNKLNTAQMMGMVIGMIALQLCTLPLVNYFEGIWPGRGYQITAGAC